MTSPSPSPAPAPAPELDDPNVPPKPPVKTGQDGEFEEVNPQYGQSANLVAGLSYKPEIKVITRPNLVEEKKVSISEKISTILNTPVF